MCSYSLKEICRHGEAGSVDKSSVEEEWQRISKVLKAFAKRDWWNWDETGLFGL